MDKKLPYFTGQWCFIILNEYWEIRKILPTMIFVIYKKVFSLYCSLYIFFKSLTLSNLSYEKMRSLTYCHLVCWLQVLLLSASFLCYSLLYSAVHTYGYSTALLIFTFTIQCCIHWSILDTGQCCKPWSILHCTELSKVATAGQGLLCPICPLLSNTAAFSGFFVLHFWATEEGSVFCDRNKYLFLFCEQY